MPRTVLLALLFASAPLAAQERPPIGFVDLYGATGLDTALIRRTAALKVGDAAPASFAAVETRLRALPGVAGAKVSLVCCEDGKSIVYIGIERRGAPRLDVRQAPNGTERLPVEVVRLMDDLDTAFVAGIRSGNAAEDDSKGHALFLYPSARAIQERFPALADKHLVLVRLTLLNAADARHRAMAATLLPYTTRKLEIVGDLVAAARDPDPTVRNNAVRALGILSTYSATPAGGGISIPLDPFLALMHSLVWTDRNKGSFALLAVTASKEPTLLAAVRRGVWAPLLEMAQWSAAGHAFPGVLLVARIAGIPEADAMAALADPAARAALIARAAATR